MDVRNLDFENGSFDVAIDKGTKYRRSTGASDPKDPGTMDAMLAVKGDVWVCTERPGSGFGSIGTPSRIRPRKRSQIARRKLMKSLSECVHRSRNIVADSCSEYFVHMAS